MIGGRVEEDEAGRNVGRSAGRARVRRRGGDVRDEGGLLAGSGAGEVRVVCVGLVFLLIICVGV